MPKHLSILNFLILIIIFNFVVGNGINFYFFYSYSKSRYDNWGDFFSSVFTFEHYTSYWQYVVSSNFNIFLLVIHLLPLLTCLVIYVGLILEGKKIDKQTIVKFYQFLLPNFYQSADKGRINRVKKFLKKGWNIEETDTNSKNVLMHAAIGGDPKMVEFLLREGANPNSKDKNGDTALSEAAFWDNLECAQVLIKNGADVNSLDNDGVSVLMGAASEATPCFVEYLIQNGANINHTDYEGDSVLMWAIQDTIPTEKMIRLLIAHGVDKTTRNNNGKTALDSLVEEETYKEDKEYLNMLEMLKI